MKTMNAVNVVQLFILVWTCSAFCRADEDFSVNCEDVTGTVGEKVNLSCNVFINRSDCCITKYKFLYPEKYKEKEICKKEIREGSCEKRNRFTYSFSLQTEMMERFRFFVQTWCGQKTTEFTVNIAETSEPVINTEAQIKKEPHDEDTSKEEHKDNKAEGRGFKVAVIVAAVSCFIIVIVPIIYKLKQNYIQRRRKKCVCLHDSPESCAENII